MVTHTMRKNKSLDSRANNQVGHVFSFLLHRNTLSRQILAFSSGGDEEKRTFPLSGNNQDYPEDYRDISLLLINSLRNNILKVRRAFACVCLCGIIKSGGAGHVSNTAERGFVQPEVIEPPPVIVFRTASDITTGCLQSDEYLMNNFNVNYMVAVIREETFSWGAAKEVKTLVNTEGSLC